MKDRIWVITKYNDSHIQDCLDSLKDETVKVIDQKKTKWPLAKAWNEALKYLNKYMTVIISNDDVIVRPETGMRLSKILHLMGEPTKTLLLSAYDTNLNRGDFGNTWLPSKIYHPQSFLFAVDKRLPEVIGEFDERFEPYLFEDTDMFYRVQKAGFDWATAVPVWHHGGGSTMTQQEVDWRNEIFEENKQRYVDKWGGLPGEEANS